MKYVEPIKNIADIKAMKRLLRQHSQRDLLFFVFGINTGMRVSDLLSLKVCDVWDGEDVKEFVYVKNGSVNDALTPFYINNSVKKELKKYLAQADLKKDDYLFISKKNEKPITRQQAYRIINSAAKEVGIPGNIGTHTLRKTFGYHAYRKGIAISILSRIFNHQSSSETLHYIGIDKNENYLVKVDVNL
ncbi:site-specific integrase [Calidifontibacillus erzurumensis]|uniref:Site-specific integrase n=1 Tax=Calidifontibacillus erzurumensis TaxID=2741433 RepID=A0A8J8KAU1_9BACI|nr:tyrosine-type recombinase/integrase [Calidifontibacillus erzurumensis]NSL50962.1 site-specific integrase [Calidifontibacillus erzurumensis]